MRRQSSQQLNGKALESLQERQSSLEKEAQQLVAVVDSMQRLLHTIPDGVVLLWDRIQYAMAHVTAQLGKRIKATRDCDKQEHAALAVEHQALKQQVEALVAAMETGADTVQLQARFEEITDALEGQAERVDGFEEREAKAEQCSLTNLRSGDVLPCYTPPQGAPALSESSQREAPV